jgi:hypothetical protein
VERLFRRSTGVEAGWRGDGGLERRLGNHRLAAGERRQAGGHDTQSPRVVPDKQEHQTVRRPGHWRIVRMIVRRVASVWGRGLWGKTVEGVMDQMRTRYSDQRE